MRRIVYTNPSGTSVTFDEKTGYFGITSLTGLGAPELNIQQQKAPYQDGATIIDQLYEEREIEIRGVIKAGNDNATRYAQRRILSSALNAKLGAGVLVYTNDHGSWSISAIPETLEFSNKNANQGNQEFDIVFRCPDPYWKDVADTVITLTSASSIRNIDILGDVSSEITALISGGGSRPKLTELIQNKHLKYDASLDRDLRLSTVFGNKTAKITDQGAFNPYLSTQFLRLASAPKSGQMIAVSPYNSVESIDGVKWNAEEYIGVSRGVEYDNESGYWTICGSEFIAYSKDGRTFTKVMITSATINSVAYSPVLRIWVACGDNGKIYTSTNLSTWTEQTSGETTNLHKVIWVSRLAAFFIAGESYVLYSNDSSYWTRAATGLSGGCQGIAYSPSLMMIAVTSGRDVYTTTDGTTWTQRTIAWTTNATLQDIVWSAEKSLFVVTGGYLTNARIASSSNGTSWTVSYESSGALNNVTYNQLLGKFYSAHMYGLLSSTDGASWVAEKSFSYSAFRTVVTNDDESIVLVAGSAGAVLRSTDYGLTWSTISIGASYTAFASAYSDFLSRFIILAQYSVDSSIHCFYSDDGGLNWTNVSTGYGGGDLPSNARVSYVTSLNSFVFAFGGVFIISKDGSGWYSYSDSIVLDDPDVIEYRFHSYVFDTSSGKFYLAGYVTKFIDPDSYYYGAVFETTDLINLSVHIVTTGSLTMADVEFRDVTIAKYLDLFICVGASGIYTSVNGSAWTQRSAVSANRVFVSNPLQEVRTVGDNGYYACSSTALSWETLAQYGIFSLVLIILLEHTSSVIFGGGSSVFVESLVEDNAISAMSESSDFSLSLQPGSNALELTSESGSFSAEITYRNRYIGV